MQTLKLSPTSVYTLSPMRNVGELQATLAKCSGKYKPSKIKGDRRAYPCFYDGMSTAEYVAKYEQLNTGAVDRRTWTTIGANTINAGFFAELNDEPCTLYSGEDSFETIDECEVIEFPESRELQGAELDAAYAEFAIAA